jgi:hypothetical protein
MNSWSIQSTLSIPRSGDSYMLMQIARRSDDCYRDRSDKSRQEAADYLCIADAPSHFIDFVRRAGALDTAEQNLVFGESLPKGLKVL